MALDAGTMRERITIEQRAAGIDSLGQPSGAWEEVDEVWARAEPLRGREYFAAGQTQSQVDTRFTIRWRSDVVPTMRVVWRSQPYDIVSVINPDTLYREGLELMCATGMRDGR